jgi:hypothetical protein
MPYIFLLLSYFAIGLFAMTIVIRDKTGIDSFPNLWINRKLALKVILLWPKYMLGFK